MKKKLEVFSEILYHLINFRIEQFKQSKEMIGIDYDSFLILSVVGSHYLKHNIKETSWDAVWKQARSQKIVNWNPQQPPQLLRRSSTRFKH